MANGRYEAKDIPQALDPADVAALLNEYTDCQQLLQGRGWRVTGQPLINAIRDLLKTVENIAE